MAKYGLPKIPNNFHIVNTYWITIPSKVALVITDGKQTRDRGEYTPLTQAAQGIKQKGVTVYALGVGKGVERSDLQAIATSEETVFTAATFAALGDIVENIRERLCEGTVVAKP